MTDKQTYAFMAAAAYDERRGDENDTHTKAIEDYLLDADRGGWRKDYAPDGAGPDSGWNNADGASYSDPSTGMQADVWTRAGGEYVIAFRGTEASRLGSNDGFRSGDGALDAGTLDDWSGVPEWLAIWAAKLNGTAIPAGIDLSGQVIAAITLVEELLADEVNPANISFTGHSLGGALAGLVSIYFANRIEDPNIPNSGPIQFTGTLIDPAPFGSSELLVKAALGFDLAAYQDLEERRSSTVDQIRDDANIEWQSLLNSTQAPLTALNYHWITGSVTDVLGTFHPSQQTAGITLNNSENSDASFLHSQYLHAMLSDDTKLNLFQTLLEDVPRLLANMELGYIFGLLSSVDGGDSGLSDDYSPDEVLSFLSVNDDLFVEFTDAIRATIENGGFVSQDLGQDHFSVSIPESTSTQLLADGDQTQTESITINELFVRIGLRWISERARELSEYHGGDGTLDGNTTAFGGDEAGVLSFNFADVTPPDVQTEDRSAYGQIQMKELLLELSANLNDADLIADFLNDGNLITGVMAEANSGQGTIFDVESLLIHSDLAENNVIVFGGDGDDTIWAALGGLNAGQADYAGHGYIWGGDGEDTVDFSSIVADSDGKGIILETEPFDIVPSVSLLDWWKASRFDGAASEVMTAVEKINLTSADDTLKINALPRGYSNDDGHQNITVNAGDAVSATEIENGDTIDAIDSKEGLTIVLQGEDGVPGEISSGLYAMSIANFDNVIGSAFEDVITGSDDRNTIRGGDGVDTIGGGLGHDDIYGGSGNDILKGGEGADFIIDSGANDGIREDETEEEFTLRELAYDGEGNDVVHGGAGADVMVYTGGADTFYGDAGDDTYIALDTGSFILSDEDKLTIVLSEDAGDPTSFFGNDLIVGNGRGVDTVIFEGINRSDVTINYSYEEVFTYSQVFDYDPIFSGWWWDPEPEIFNHYITVGTYEIIVNATGSSLTIESVSGRHTRGENGGPQDLFEASISLPFSIQFADYYLDWATAVLDPATNFYTLKDSPLSSTAFAAEGALGAERSTIENTVEGDEGDNPDLVGSTNSDQINGHGGDDKLFGGRGDDKLSGGAGADQLNGGSGSDTASYASASERVSIRMFDNNFRAGDAVGDELISIENLVGSGFDDLLGGDSEANEISGGAGDDNIGGNSGNDSLFGDSGDDRISGGAGDDFLDGGDGSDYMRAGSGNDIMLGGEGDDRLISEGTVIALELQSPGFDVLDGGNGVDSAEFWYTDGLTVDLSAGRADFDLIDDFTILKNIENITTDRGDDVVYGDDQNNVINVGGGDDLIYGGAGDDTLIGGDGEDRIFGGVGIDTVQINAVSSTATFEFVEGGVKIVIDDSSPDHTFGMNEGSFTVYDDVEFIQFNDVTLTYGDIAGSLQTEFAVIDDYFRMDEGETGEIDLLANDLEFGGDQINITTVNGIAMAPGDTQRLSVGSTITMLPDGRISFDQAGAFAWLGNGETHTETLTYTATDSSGIEKTSTVTLKIDGVPSGPDSVDIENDLVWVTTDDLTSVKLTVANFNIAKSIVVIDEEYIDPNALPLGVTIEEIGGSTYILYGGDDAIVLEDISPDAWRFVSAQKVEGGSGNDTIVGTDETDVILGHAGNDSISSGAGGDIVFGGDGDDNINTYYGNGQGDDILFGNDGSDDLRGGDGNDQLIGGADDDILSGGTGDDLLRGGAGDDTLRGGEGQDILDGGDGVDSVYFQQDLPNDSYIGIHVDLTTGFATWGNNKYPYETLINIENVFGTSGDDILIGDSQDNRMDGISGNDLIKGGAGNDILSGFYGNNVLYGEEGDDTLYVKGSGTNHLYGGAGNDTIFVDYGLNIVDGGDGIDTLELISVGFSNNILNSEINMLTGVFGTGADLGSFVNIENIVGDWYHNLIKGNASNNFLDGERGNDILFGFGGDDQLLGGDGNDTLRGGDGVDTLTGGNGADKFVLESNGQDTVMDFVAGEDKISLSVGVSFSDLTFLQDGADTLISDSVSSIRLVGVLTSSLAETDFIDGGPDAELFDYRGSPIGVDVEASTGADMIYGSDFSDTIDASSGADILNGGAGDDSLTGGAGDDMFVYTGGNDTIMGDGFNHGNDTLDLSQYMAAQVSFAVDGNDVVITTPDGTIRLEDEVFRTSGHYHSNIENIIFADGYLDEQGLRDRAINDQNTIGDDTIVMGGGSDTLDYLGGNDTIAGNGLNHGNDTLDLSQYTAAQVSFRNVGADVEISTPDGVITLVNQIMRAVGHYHSNIEHVIFADGSLDEAGIRTRAVDDQSTAGDDAIVATKFDDVIIYRGGNDSIAGRFSNYGNDALDLSQYNADQVSFLNVGDDILITTPDGSITLDQQIRSSIAFGQSNIETIVFADGSLDEAGIRTRAVDDQSTAGDDAIVATKFDDVINYRGGNDSIAGRHSGYGNDTLNLGQYTAAQVSFVNSGLDIIITTPDGSITLQSQIWAYVGHPQSNIETIIFSDGTLDEAGIRTRAVDDQSSAGDDVIVATKFADVINGGAGDDVLTGGSGADIIELDFGSGSDVMTDFEDGVDIIDLSATGLTFAELAIWDNGSGDVVIGFDDGVGGDSLQFDKLTLTGITAAELTSADFQFG